MLTLIWAMIGMAVGVWLAAGWRDLRRAPGPRLAFGVFLTALSYAVLWGLAAVGLLYLTLPAISFVS